VVAALAPHRHRGDGEGDDGAARRRALARAGHLALSWHLNGAFQYDPDPTHASRVDVYFTAEGDDATRVELAHSELDRHGDGWTDLRTGVSGEGGWPELMNLYAKRVAS
jgi:hypothetical protein